MENTPYFAEMRTNTRFDFDPKTNSVLPVIELIFLSGSPDYSIGKNANGITRKMKIVEQRILVTPNTLQVLAQGILSEIKNMNIFDKIAQGFTLALQENIKIDFPNEEKDKK
jgi:hypothetical protein